MKPQVTQPVEWDLSLKQYFKAIRKADANRKAKAETELVQGKLPLDYQMFLALGKFWNGVLAPKLVSTCFGDVGPGAEVLFSQSHKAASIVYCKPDTVQIKFADNLEEWVSWDEIMVSAPKWDNHLCPTSAALSAACWNLMCRCSNACGLRLSHISWVSKITRNLISHFVA